jgi:nucleoside-triphosphatase THEP1
MTGIHEQGGLLMFPKNMLLSGPPGCGKTTIIRKIIQHLFADQRLAGFYTQEIQHKDCVDYALKRGLEMISRLDFHGDNHGGRDEVNTRTFEVLLAHQLDQVADGVNVFLIDQIGKEERVNQPFMTAVMQLLDSPVPVWATVAASCRGFLRQIQDRQDLMVVRITAENRDEVAKDLIASIPPRQEPTKAPNRWQLSGPLAEAPGTRPLSGREQVLLIRRLMRKLGWIEPRSWQARRKAN